MDIDNIPVDTTLRTTEPSHLEHTYSTILSLKMGKRGLHASEGQPQRKRSRHSSDSGGKSTVFVGNLSFSTSWQDLKDHMRRAGNVDSANILKTPAGKSKGCALVDYQNSREAQRAVRELSGSLLNGNRIDVREDQPLAQQRSSSVASRERDNMATGSIHTTNSSATSIYVGNLSYDCTWQNLKDEFRRFGQVEHASIAQFPNSGRSKGYGLVRMAHRRNAETAIRQLDGITIQGRAWHVRFDRVETETGAGDSDSDQVSASLFVGNLSFDCSWQELKDYFRKCGPVAHVEIPEGQNGRKKGYGIVTFQNASDAARAIRQLDGQVFQDRPLQVREDRQHKAPAAGAYQKCSDSSSSTVFVKNLSLETTSSNLKKHFAKIGTVKHAEVMLRDGGTKSKGWGLVQFANPTQAEQAIRELNGVALHGHVLEVRLDTKGGAASGGSDKPKRRQQQQQQQQKKQEEKSEGEDYDFKIALETALKSSR